VIEALGSVLADWFTLEATFRLTRSHEALDEECADRVEQLVCGVQIPDATDRPLRHSRTVLRQWPARWNPETVAHWEGPQPVQHSSEAAKLELRYARNEHHQRGFGTVLQSKTSSVTKIHLGSC
jgi:hypothetical protein